MAPLASFVDSVDRIKNYRLLELGTRKWGSESTHHKHLFPEGNVVLTDFLDGDDVDIVSDAHNLKEFDSVSFDGVFSASTFEHIEYPWIAAMAIHRVVKTGGYVYVQTHHTFPVHGYPHDYTRWTDKGLAALFDWAGFRVIEAEMFEPCHIVPRPDYPVWDELAPAYIGVALFAVKE